MFPFWFLVCIFFAIAIVLAKYHLWILAFLFIISLLIFAVYSRSYSRRPLPGFCNYGWYTLFFLLHYPSPGTTARNKASPD